MQEEVGDSGGETGDPIALRKLAANDQGKSKNQGYFLSLGLAGRGSRSIQPGGSLAGKDSSELSSTSSYSGMGGLCSSETGSFSRAGGFGFCGAFLGSAAGIAFLLVLSIG
jgi:hypothetical protein